MPWFKRADGVLFNILEMYPDTIARLRSEGWAEVPDPTALTTNEPANVAAQAEVVTPASSPERAALAPTQQAQADTSDTKKAPVAKRAPVKAKTVRKRTPVRRPSSVQVRKAVS